MTWLTENPTGLYILFAVIAGLSLAIFFSTRRLIHLTGVLIALLAGVAVYFIDQAVVTDREQVEINALLLASAAQRGEVATIEKLLSPQFQMDGHSREALLSKARRYLNPDRLRTITFYDLGVTGEPPRLVVHCNATASGNFENFTVDPPYIGTVELTFEKEGNDWRITGMVIRGMGGAEQRIP